MSQHSLIIRFKYRGDDFEPLYELEQSLGEALDESGVGEYEGHEMSIDGKSGEMTMSGPDAHAIWDTIQPVLEGARFMRGADAELHLGDGADAETDVFTVGS
jgi:hypothetical protein